MLISTLTKPNALGVIPGQRNIPIRPAIYTMAISLLFSSCASFSDSPISRHKIKLRENNVSKLSGTYQLFPDLAYTKTGGTDMLRNQPKTERFHQYISKRKIDFNHSGNFSVEVKLLGNKQVGFYFKKDSFIVDSVTLSARLQSRGLLLLGNKYLEVQGVPYIFGGSKSEKTRIGLASDGGLILNHAYDRSGAFFFFMAGQSYDNAYHFKRINSN